LEELLLNPFKSDKIFHLSFDDGLKQCAEIIAPVLLKKGVPATFFVNTGFVDNKQLFHKYKASLIFNKFNEIKNIKTKKILADNGLTGNSILKVEINQNKLIDEVASVLEIDFKEFLENEKPYMTTVQLRKLQQDGFTIGAHSVDHPEFYTISDNQIIGQVKESMQWITDNINPEIKAFSFPFTDDGVSEKVLNTIHEENLCNVTFGTAGIKCDSWKNHFQRYPVEQPGDFVRNLKGEYIYFFLRKLTGKATVTH
jgi:peptidoglycan/xylan/chitin deacetylase (PgdA/CDA1 family)